jgi:N-acetylglucosaminyldiphosphoundecaprenol N-acetyl-beta-D-mannosaminyltransferase
MTPSFKTKCILRTPICVLPLHGVANIAVDWARMGDKPRAVGLTDVHVLTRARHNEYFGNVFKKFDLACPDGMPLIWEINRGLEPSEKLNGRVSGAELMTEVIRQSSDDEHLAHFFLGGSEDLLKDLCDKLRGEHTQIHIAGTYSPPFGPWPSDETERIAKMIKHSGASFVWVGLGCPKQELWIGENLHGLPTAVYFSVGAAFAFHAGHVKRAPMVFQKIGLEWLYRIIAEPKRLWKRYATFIPLYCYYQMKDKFNKCSHG